MYAIRSYYVYRAGMNDQAALAILEREKDWGQWDPYLIEEFIKIIIRENESSYSIFEKTG